MIAPSGRVAIIAPASIPDACRSGSRRRDATLPGTPGHLAPAHHSGNSLVIWFIRRHVSNIIYAILTVITAPQLRAARALLGMDQRALADAAQLSLPTIQRMEASQGVIRGNVDSLMKLIAALEAAGIELITDNAVSAGGGRGVRLRQPNGKGG